MKGITAISHFALLNNQAVTGATGSDLILNEIDCGGAQNGTLILIVDNQTGSDLANVEVWTSRASNFATSTSALAAVASDSTAKVKITSDSSNFYSMGVLGASISDVTISSTNVISNLTEDGMYVLNLKGLSRYLAVQYDSDGPLSRIAAVFVGHDLMSAPFQTERAEY